MNFPSRHATTGSAQRSGSWLRFACSELWYRFRRITLIEVIVGMIILLIIAAIATPIWFGLNEDDASSVYTGSFTNPGQCLHGTPYDPQRSAQLVTTRFSGSDVLVVIPQGANSYQPAILMFGISNALLSNPELTPADHQTAAFMQKHCHAFGSGL